MNDARVFKAVYFYKAADVLLKLNFELLLWKLKHETFLLSRLNMILAFRDLMVQLKMNCLTHQN